MGYREEYGALLEAIIAKAERTALQYFRSETMRVDRKLDGSVVTQADRAIEEMARAKVAASGLALEVLGEEMGGAEETRQPRLIIDPIDGTEEFSRGIPMFGTLLAIEREGEVVAGMISAPALGARWWAYRGQGAWRDGRALRVSKVAKLSEAMIFTAGTGPGNDFGRRGNMRRVEDAARRSRSMGGFWQHMLVAEGAVDAAMDLKSKPWDLAPSILIVEEAGGRSTNLLGERTIYDGTFFSSNGQVHEEILGYFR